MPEVVLVHGLWYRAWSMLPLKRRLVKAGFEPRCFSYPTVSRDPEDSIPALAAYCGDRRPHLVGHSLGGLLIIRMLAMGGAPWDGRVVLLGSPLGGSRVARQVSAFGPTSHLLGRSADLLGRGIGPTGVSLDCGMIAGTRNTGLGRFTGARIEAGDGTVALEETRHAMVRERIELPVSHTGMLLSRSVAREVAEFLSTGHFSQS